MVPAPCPRPAPVPPPAYHRARARRAASVRITALTLVTPLRLLDLCRLAGHAAQRRCPPPLPAGPGGRRRTYAEEALLLIALLRTLWRLSYEAMRDWLRAWPALALACGLPTGPDGRPRVPSCSQQGKRAAAAGAPPYEMLLVLAWRRRDPDAAVGHAPAHHRAGFLRGFRAHTLLCRSSGLPLFVVVAPANAHDAPFAKLLLTWAMRLYGLRPRCVRLDAAYWGLALIRWIHGALGAVAVIPWNPKRAKNRACLPPTWTRAELSKRGSIERFFGRAFRVFGLQRPPVRGWTAVTQRVALTSAATVVVALAAHQANRPELIRSPKRVLAHLWEASP